MSVMSTASDSLDGPPPPAINGAKTGNINTSTMNLLNSLSAAKALYLWLFDATYNQFMIQLIYLCR